MLCSWVRFFSFLDFLEIFLPEHVDLVGSISVEEIEFIVNEHGVSDAFMGLILVPLVEKAAEHLTGIVSSCPFYHEMRQQTWDLAVDEAWDNQMNFALAHCMGATIQTALFNSSLVVIVGWGLHKPMDLNFEIFNIVVLIMAIIVVGNFLRDQVGHCSPALSSWQRANAKLKYCRSLIT